MNVPKYHKATVKNLKSIIYCIYIDIDSLYDNTTASHIILR